MLLMSVPVVALSAPSSAATGLGAGTCWSAPTPGEEVCALAPHGQCDDHADHAHRPGVSFGSATGGLRRRCPTRLRVYPGRASRVLVAAVARHVTRPGARAGWCEAGGPPSPDGAMMDA
ncbi:hypothetical protein QJS66_13240 [Kocuria rhizophila]|nr:hypothetical protein QJS66_13240 [Kocuria rhizophila]